MTAPAVGRSIRFTTRNVAAITMLTVVSAAVLLTCGRVEPAQDWIPFRVAPTLLGQGWTNIYAATSASSLFDVPDGYRVAAERSVSRDGTPAFAPGTLTRFLSPPPAAFFLWFLKDADWRTDLLVWRLVLAVPLVVALFHVAKQGCVDDDMRVRWALACVLGVPLLLYVVVTAQTSAWLLVATAVTVTPATRTSDGIGAIVLALVVLAKATPLIVIAGLWWIGRRRLAAWAAVLTVLAVIVLLPFTGLEGWRLFVESSLALARRVITDWNNAAVDADALRWITGRAIVEFQTPDAVALAVSWLARLSLVGLAVRAAVRKDAPAPDRAAAVWIGWLAATPLLWVHYFLALLPLIGAKITRVSPMRLLLVAALSSPVVLRIAGVDPVVVGHVATAAWIGSAVWLLTAAELEGRILTSANGRV
jgi:hypothetical protein